MRIISFLLICLVSFSSCENKRGNGSGEINEKEEIRSEKPESPTEEQSKIKYAPKSIDEQTAANLKNFLRDYTKEYYDDLGSFDKQFQFYKTDLNKDGNDEIFVRLQGGYFCGSGGCTFLLLDKYGEMITRFTVTRAPIFIETKQVNGWSLLLVKDGGVFKELAFENGSYPTNPSVLPKAPYDAPSGHAEVMFHDDLYPSKPFEF